MKKWKLLRLTWSPRRLSHTYSNTLVFPQTQFPSRSDPEKNKDYLATATEQVYLRQPVNREAVFVLHDGPPYANGDLHLGHIINKVLKDIVNRTQLAAKKTVIYIPGFDCHGLPIELKALASVKARSLTPAEIRAVARKLALSTITAQTETFQAFGIMGEWKNPYKTLDLSYELRELKIFRKMLERGMIRRQNKPVYWGCETGTALAEGELEYNDQHKSTAAYLKFPLVSVPSEFGEKPVSALIWTSTPWTVAANRAICFNENLDYNLVELSSGERLVVACGLVETAIKEECRTIGQFKGSILARASYRNPLLSEQTVFPFIHGAHVTSTTGTGLVHTAPGHGQEDYLVGLAHNLPVYSPVDGRGKYNGDLAPGLESLVGLKVLKEGTNAMLDLLTSHGMVHHIHQYTHSYPYDWRSKKPVIIRATPQWFADLSEVKDEAASALEKVQFVPPRGATRLASFIKNRTEWCISRQRAWGVPIPVLYEKETNKPLMTNESVDHIISTMSETGSDAWFEPEENVERWLTDNLKHKAVEYYKGTDTVDVWFDSGSSWSFIETVLKERNVTNREYIADIYLEGSDQHRGWFQSSLLTKLAAKSVDGIDGPMASNPPYRTILTHGFTLDAKGRKMSKSLGNTVSPLDGIEGKSGLPKLGVDGMRLWVASCDYTSDISVSTTVFKRVVENLRKYRSTFRYLLGSIGEKSELFKSQLVFEDDARKLSNIDVYILVKLDELLKRSKKNYYDYGFFRMVKDVNYFINSEVSPVYFNIIKDQMYAGDHSSSRIEAIKFTMQQLLLGLLQILSPVIPVMTQEVWAYLPESYKSSFSPLLNSYDFTSLDYISKSRGAQCGQFFDHLWKIRDEALKLIEVGRKQDKSISNSLETNLVIECSDASKSLLLDTASLDEIADMLLVSKVMISEEPPTSAYCYSGEVVGIEECRLFVVKAKEHKCPRCWKFTSEEEDRLCGRCEEVLKKKRL